MTKEVNRLTFGHNSTYVYTTEAWAELGQTQGVEVCWLGQFQDLKMLLKDLHSLLGNSKHETN